MTGKLLTDRKSNLKQDLNIAGDTNDMKLKLKSDTNGDFQFKRSFKFVLTRDSV